MHSSVTAAETWTAADSPHDLPYDTEITAAVTIEPCAVVTIAAGKTVTVAAGGSIVAAGTAAQPISIGAEPGAAPWASIRFIGGTGKLAYTTLDHGGDPLNSGPEYAAVLDVRGGSDITKLQVLEVDHVTVSGSASQGLYLNAGGQLTDSSTNLTVTGSVGAPIHSWTSAAGTIPSGTYTGNGSDVIILSAMGCSTAGAVGEGVSNGTVTLHQWGVPYLVGHSASAGDLCVTGGPTGNPLASLVIEPGVTMQFKKGGQMRIDEFEGTDPATGALVAVGTAAAPIVFTSAQPTPAAGDWNGIWLLEVPVASTKIAYAKVEYAGAASVTGSASCPNNPSGINDAAIRIFGPPSGEIVTNTAISDCASNGIDRGYQGTPTDFLPTNTFTNVAGCKETYPRPTTGPCPTSVPCP